MKDTGFKTSDDKPIRLGDELELERVGARENVRVEVVPAKAFLASRPPSRNVHDPEEHYLVHFKGEDDGYNYGYLSTWASAATIIQR